MRLSDRSTYSSLISKQGLALTLLALVISLLSAFLAYSEKVQGLNWLFYDNAMRFSQLKAVDDIVVIDIDDKSLSQIGRWPWPRSVHADLLDQLNIAKTKAVVFDVLFPELDKTNKASDIRFAKAIKRHGNVILPLYLETLGLQGQVIESPPHGLFYREVAAIGHVHLQAEEDGVVRGVFLKEGVGTPFWPHLSLALFDNLSTHDNKSESRGIPGSRADSHLPQRTHVNIAKDFHNLVPMPASEQGLRHYSYSDILEGAIDLKNLNNKVVFIGATASGLGDVLATPIGSMNGVELNAWIFQALRSDMLIQTLPETMLGLMTFLIVLCLVLVLGRLSPRLFLVLSLVSMTSLLSLSTILLLFGKLWVPPASAIIGLITFYPLWSWLRAETILRFLHEEIAALSAINLIEKDQVQRHQAAHHFLTKMGIINPESTQQTQKGEAMTQRFHDQSQQSHDTNFWQTQLAKYDEDLSSSATTFSGVEVVARTISQLNTIKDNDRKNRQLIEKSLSSLQDAVCITNLCGEITFTNHCFNQWFRNAQQPLPLLDILAKLELKSGSSWVQVLSKLYETHQLFTDEARLTTAENKQFLCQANLVSINEQFNDTVIFTFTDISLLKAAENARSEALSFLSHDLRSPMVSVLAILDRFHIDKSSDNSSLSTDAIHHIEALVRKNLEYSENFLQLSKADSLAEMHMNPCDLHAVLDAAQVQAMALAEAKSIAVITKRCDDDVWVLGDIDLLERALNNLISNAIKFSPAGSKLTLTLHKNKETAELSVSDQGIGVAPKDQSVIFDRFTRTKTTESIEGAGLGLNFVATVAQKHQGRVELTSEIHVGSCFTLHLPVLSEQDIFEVDD